MLWDPVKTWRLPGLRQVLISTPSCRPQPTNQCIRGLQCQSCGRKPTIESPLPRHIFGGGGLGGGGSADGLGGLGSKGMGKGKSGPDHWVAIIKPGRVLYEMQGVSEEDAREAFRLASHKLPFKTKFIKRREVLK